MSQFTPPGNRLLGRLPATDYERLRPHLKPVTLDLKQVLYPPRALMDFVYFPNRAVISILTVMEDGTAIEVAAIGNEGMVGLPVVLGVPTTPYQFIVQIGGEALRMRAQALYEQLGRNDSLRRLLALYHYFHLTQVSQGVACNGLHTVQQRCCRWLLTTSDQVQSRELPITHESLAQMLGVRRASVTEVLRPLQQQALIRTRRGSITIVNRKGVQAASCECYRRIHEEYKRLFA
jgi:CRP-like cAMP-binding protein